MRLACGIERGFAKTLKFLAVCTAMALSTASSLAAAVQGMSSPTATVVYVFPRAGIGMDFSTTATTSPMGCSNSNYFRIASTTQSNSASSVDYNAVSPSALDYNAMVSTVLLAYAGGKQVSFWVYACDVDGASLVNAVMAH